MAGVDGSDLEDEHSKSYVALIWVEQCETWKSATWTVL